MNDDERDILRTIAAATSRAADAAASASAAVVTVTRLAAKAQADAGEALQRIVTHAAVYAVEKSTIIQNQVEAKKDREEMHRANQESIRRIYSLLWKVALALITGMAGILATIVFSKP